MMIGGIDIRLATWSCGSPLERAVRVVRQFWPNAVFRNAITGDRFGGFDCVPFNQIMEIFVYRDSDAADGWEAEGAIPSLSNTMVHIIKDPGLLTIVLDEDDEFSRKLTRAISISLLDGRFRAAATLEAA